MSPGAIKAWVIQSAGKNRGFEDEDDENEEEKTLCAWLVFLVTPRDSFIRSAATESPLALAIA